MFIAKLKKIFDNFYDNHRECKQCNIQRSMIRYYENKDKLSNQRNLKYAKKEMCYLQSLN